MSEPAGLSRPRGLLLGVGAAGLLLGCCWVGFGGAFCPFFSQFYGSISGAVVGVLLGRFAPL